MPSLPYDENDEGWEAQTFIYWRRALPIMQSHFRRYGRGKLHASCVECGGIWPCDARRLSELLAETTEMLVIAQSARKTLAAYLEAERQGRQG